MRGEQPDQRIDRERAALAATISASAQELTQLVGGQARADGAEAAPPTGCAAPAPRPSERGQLAAGAGGRVTARFVRQHEDLSAVGKELVAHLDSTKIAHDPSTIRRLLAAFSGKLRVHAAMEQEALYPRLLANSDPAIRDKAQALLDEVGGLYELFFKHLARWSDAAAIKEDPEGFCRETMQLLHRLKVRMQRENEELYPLVDAPG